MKILLSILTFISFYLAADGHDNLDVSYKNTLSKYYEAKKQADAGSDEAMLMVFNIFYDSYPLLEGKVTEAASYLKKSALNGNRSAQYNMGFLQQNGDVFEKNLEKAIEWYLKAESGGHIISARQLGFVFLEIFYKDDSKFDVLAESQKWFLKAAMSGDVPSMRQYAVGILSHNTDAESFQVAENWLLKATDENDVLATRYLAEFYVLKFEHSDNEEYSTKAKKLFEKAAQLGDEKSSAWLKSNN